MSADKIQSQCLLIYIDGCLVAHLILQRAFASVEQNTRIPGTLLIASADILSGIHHPAKCIVHSRHVPATLCIFKQDLVIIEVQIHNRL